MQENKVTKLNREFHDPLSSTRGGVGGMFETFIRRFKSSTALFIMMPIYAFGCLIIGVAAVPGFEIFDWMMSFAPQEPGIPHYFALGVSLAAAFFTCGFSLLIILPTMNFICRARLKPWRGPYYSLEAIRWFLHNGFTYLARFTFLEFVTPTPFSIWFYQAMGMKIGHGTALNTTYISDPSMITLGNKVTIGGSVTIVAHYGQGGFLVLAPVHIGNGVTVGLKATIMGGVTIGDGAKILPNSVVMPKVHIPAGELWGGVPARKIES